MAVAQASRTDLAAGITARLRRCPQFSSAISDPASGLSYLVGVHAALKQQVVAQHPSLAIVSTKLSDEEGTTVRQSLDGTAANCVQTMASHQQPIDWAHHSFGIYPGGLTYSKGSVFVQDACPAPHLELELVHLGFGPEPSFIFFLSLDPRVDLVLHPEWIDRYVHAVPEGAPRSWRDFELATAQHAGWSRFASRNFHVRAFAHQALLFQVPDTPDNRAVIGEVVTEGTALWLAWLAQDAADGRAQATDPQLLKELQAHNWAWRRFGRREEPSKVAKAVEQFGQQAVQDYWDSQAGEPHIRVE